MSYDGTLSFGTVLDLKGMTEGMKKLQGFITQNQGFFTSMINAVDATGLLEQKLTVLTGSSDSAEQALARLEDSALSAQYGFGTVAAAVDDLVTHGMSLNGAIQAVTAWGDAVATYAGSSSTALTSVTGTLADLQTAGTVSMSHVNALMDAGIPVAETYAAAMGTSVSQALTELGSGTVNAASFLATMNSAIENGAGSLPALAGGGHTSQHYLERGFHPCAGFSGQRRNSHCAVLGQRSCQFRELHDSREAQETGRHFWKYFTRHGKGQ